ncbi:MAG: invasion associated locus B family protein [Proteobacteria bacterium]|nr:invasion associated locus B family protein [Pseudomonadota bacterium]
MDRRIMHARAATMRNAVLATVAGALVWSGMDASALAQQPQPQQRPAPRAKPAQAQQRPAQPPAAAPAAAADQPQLIYSPWTKFCLKGKEANAKQVCFTGKDGRIESGMPVVAAVLIEPEGDPKKVMRVTLPLGMQLAHGTRVLIDQGQPANGPYVICFTNGCMADYEVPADMVTRLKKGQSLIIQAINATGQPISLPLPLAEFAKAYDGPPTDPKEFEAQQKKLQDELQKRAEEARKTLESQQAQPQTPNKTQ